MSKILLVVEKFPFPLNSGGNIRTHNFVASLSRDHDLSILYSSCENEASVAEYSARFSVNSFLCEVDHAKTIPLNVFSRLAAGFNASWEERSYDEDFEKRLLQISQAGAFDFIFCRYIDTAKYLIALRDKLTAKIIVDLDDLEFVKQRRTIRFNHSRYSFKYWRLMFNNFLFTRFHKALNAVDVVCVCSAGDKDLVLKKRLCKKVSVIPNAVGGVGESMAPATRAEHQERNTLLCCGDLNYAPNVDGLLWFIEKVLPGIVRSAAEVRLHMVGRNPDPRLIEAVDNRNVFLFPNVPSVMPYYKKASMTVVPLFSGGGTRIKILEAFAYSRPVVSTTIGAEGLNAVDRSHLLIADTEQSFAEACLELLENYELAQKLTKRGLSLVQREYSLAAVSEKIKRLVEIEGSAVKGANQRRYRPIS